MMNTAKRYDIQIVKEFVKNLLEKSACREDVSEAVSGVLLEAEICGMRTHGLRLLPIYLRRIEKGTMNPDPSIQVVRDAGAVCVIDADGAPGPYGGSVALDRCLQNANRHGLAVTGVRNSNHFGMAGYYAHKGAKEGYITMATTNGSPAMAPWGAKDAFFAATPIAIGVPGRDRNPLVLDMALTNSARARIRIYAQEGRDIPSGWALDPDGMPTNDPQAALRGSLLPIGGYKGYGLAFMLEILCAVFTGALLGPDVGDLYLNTERSQGLGHFFMALKVDTAIETEQFNAGLSRLIDMVHACAAAPGFDEVLIPGEKEARQKSEQMLHGLQLNDDTVCLLNQELAKHSLPQIRPM